VKRKIIITILISVFSVGLCNSGFSGEAKLTDLILDFAKSIKINYMSRTWDKKMTLWKSKLEKADSNLMDLKKAILFLDQHITMRAYKRKYQTTVQDWPLYLVSAQSKKQIAKILLQINSSLNNYSRIHWWKQREKQWTERLKQLM
jgi:hypothetical protein